MNAIKLGVGPFFGGALFAIGLGVSGMTESKNIIAFLDVFGSWQGELILVMGSALVFYGVFFRLITKKAKPLFGSEFSLPISKAIDKRLLIGAAFFGVGWGITGLCPGPGLVAIVSGQAHAVVFVCTMMIGMFIGRSDFGQSLFQEKES